MARRYLMICNNCGGESLQERETLPPGWLVISAGGHGLDFCSAACACEAMASSPKLRHLNPSSVQAPRSLPGLSE